MRLHKRIRTMKLKAGCIETLSFIPSKIESLLSRQVYCGLPFPLPFCFSFPPLPSFPHGCQSVTLPHAALLSSENRTGFWYIFFSKGWWPLWCPLSEATLAELTCHAWQVSGPGQWTYGMASECSDAGVSYRGVTGLVNTLKVNSSCCIPLNPFKQLTNPKHSSLSQLPQASGRQNMTS